MSKKTIVKRGDVRWLLRKIELCNYHIGLVDAFRLCSLHTDIYGDKRCFPNRSVEDQLICMYGDLWEWLRKNKKPIEGFNRD